MDYKKLFEDKKNGKVDEHMTIVMDSDGGYWKCDNFDLTEEQRDEKEELYKERYGTPGGYGDVVEILNAAGMNAEWC